MLTRLRPWAWIGAIAGLLWLIFPFGFPNYDTAYALVWGRQLADGTDPDYDAPIPPTPHPLADLWGVLVTPLGDGASTATVVLAYLTLGAIGYLVYRLGALWFDRPIGLVAAAIVLTRAPFLSNGLRAYVDLPFIALSLAALAVETRRPRAGWPVLALLATAGLLRPEAWLFGVVYWAYLAFDLQRREGAWRLASRRERDARDLTLLGALAVSAPLIWVAFDLITTGDPAYSWTGTRDTVETLGRQTGPVDLVLYGPRRLGEVLQWPGMVGAAGGGLLCIALLRRRSLLGAAGVVLALAAFALLAIGGLAIIPRYTMLAAALLAVFCAAALLGWRLLAADHPWRRRWQAFAVIVLLMFGAWIPNQYDLLSQVHTDIEDQSQVEGDLHDLADSGVFDERCTPISVPNHRAVPRLALWLDLSPSEIVSSSQQRQPRRGYFLDVANEFVLRHFVLDPNDPARLDIRVPPGFHRVREARNDSWKLYARCG